MLHGVPMLRVELRAREREVEYRRKVVVVGGEKPFMRSSYACMLAWWSLSPPLPSISWRIGFPTGLQAHGPSKGRLYDLSRLGFFSPRAFRACSRVYVKCFLP